MIWIIVGKNTDNLWYVVFQGERDEVMKRLSEEQKAHPETEFQLTSIAFAVYSALLHKGRQFQQSMDRQREENRKALDVLMPTIKRDDPLRSFE